MPDPYQYQEFNAFYLDKNFTPEVSTFQANFILFFNYSAVANVSTTTSQSADDTLKVHRRGRTLDEVPKAIRNFMGYQTPEAAENKRRRHAQTQVGDVALNGTSYRPMNPRYIVNSENNVWAPLVNLSVTMNKGQQARVLIYNPQNDFNDTARRMVNPDLFPRPQEEIESRLQQVGFKYNTTGSFSFNFTDIYAQETLLTSMYRKLHVTDLYSEIGLVLPNQRCFGLGQRNGRFQLDQGTYTFNARARDDGLPKDDGLGGKGGNHIHPFIMCQTNKTKEFFGMFFVSTGPQVFEIVKFTNSSRMVLNYITIGGVLEFYVIMLGDAQNIISRYHSMIGMPVMPAYYSLGIFHGSNSYDSWSAINAVYNNYNGSATGEKQALEGVFVETFNQKPHWTFTVNSDKFPNIADEVDKIHGRNQRIIFGASTALNPDNSYPWFVQANSAKCLIRSIPLITNGPLKGILDLVPVTYLDSYSGCFESFMSSILPSFSQSTARGLDGLLLKDSYAPNHVNGQINLPSQERRARNLGAAPSAPTPAPQVINEEMVGFYSPYQINNDTEQQTGLSTYYLPFVPAFKYSGALDNMSISLNATVGDSTGSGRYSALLVRNGISAFAIKRTFNAIVSSVTKNATRPLIFSDASWAGSGAYSVALVTDLYRSWDNLQNLIPQVLQLSMSGFASVMVDACGSLGPMDEDLCTRWTQLSTFMPMVRNYFNATYRNPQNGSRVNTDPSEPWIAKTDSLKLAYAAMSDRLRFSRYLYTQLYLAHTVGGSLVRPLFFEFPTDEGCFWDAAQSTTFMLGEALKVSPVLTPGKKDGDQYQAYFPGGKRWVHVYDSSQIIDTTSGGKNVTLTADSASVNVHQKSGTIIPYLNNNKGFKTTRDVETGLATTIRIVRDPFTKMAEGNLMIDDGISPNIFSPDYFNIWDYKTYDKKFAHFAIRMSSQNTINFMLQNGDQDYHPSEQMMYQYLDKIEILDAEDIQNVDFACALNETWSYVDMQVFYSNATKTLTIKPVSSQVTFDHLIAIKFGVNGTDPSWCEGFFYKSQIVEDTEQYVRFNLATNQPNLKELVAEFTLLDDEGSIDVQITTLEDYVSEGKILYRPPSPDFYSLDYFKKNPPTKKLFDFVQQETDAEFAFRIQNDRGNTVYWSDPLRLLVESKFVMNSGIFVPNEGNGAPLYGLGERAGRAHLKDQDNFVHTLWPYDAPNPIDDGKPPGKNMYGYHPVYYYQANTSDWMAVFDVGTYASDYFVNNNAFLNNDRVTQITKVAVGGMIHKIFLQGKNIEEVILKYQRLTGFQAVPPMWAFGWNQCKFGYYNSEIWWDAYEQYKNYSIPLDTMWGDIDYMDDYKVFTYSKQSYADLPQRVAQIRSEGRQFVPIIDNAIAVRPGQNYEAYEEGLKNKVFIMRPDMSAPATGGVWPGHAYYPDFFKNETKQWWFSELQKFNQQVQFDGIWLDMNEPSSTCTGYCYQSERPTNAIKYQLPYWPGQRDLEVQALGLDTINTGMPYGNDSKSFRTHLDARSLYAMKESQATYDYLKQGNKRPFILSRSSSPGIQKWAFHWLADNWSKEEWLSTSVDSLYGFNLFGIPMMGSDICGFNLEASPELCTRWHQLGVFYPFSRNHKNSVWKRTEPYQFNFTVPGMNLTYTDLIRTAIQQRYSLVRYIYSSFHGIGQFGGSFFKPLYYEFQDENNVFDDDSTQTNIQLGHALKLSIQTRDLNQDSTEYLFPASRWCQVMPTVDPKRCWDTTPQGGASPIQRMESDIASYQVHIRGGRIIPFQDAKGLNVMKTGDLMANPTDLWILANKANSPVRILNETYTGAAAGFIYLDDGSSATDIARSDFYAVIESDSTLTLHFNSVQTAVNADKLGKAAQVGTITFVWASSTGFDKLAGKPVTLTQVVGADISLGSAVYDAASDTLSLKVVGGAEQAVWKFWEIKQISIGK